MANEVVVGLAWLYETLFNDATLQGYAPGGVWRTEAPPATPAPYVIMLYQENPSKDAQAFGGRVYSNMVWQVLAVGPSSDTTGIANAANRIDTLITVTQVTAIPNGTLIGSFRLKPLLADLLINGEAWTNIGGEYRMFLKAS